MDEKVRRRKQSQIGEIWHRLKKQGGGRLPFHYSGNRYNRHIGSRYRAVSVRQAGLHEIYAPPSAEHPWEPISWPGHIKPADIRCGPIAPVESFQQPLPPSSAFHRFNRGYYGGWTDT